MPTECTRAFDAMKRTDKMPGHRMKPRALRELIRNIGQHRREDVLHRRERIGLAEHARIDGQ